MTATTVLSSSTAEPLGSRWCTRAMHRGARSIIAAVVVVMVTAGTSGAVASTRAAPRLAHLFTRTTDDGVRVAAFVGNVPVNLICAPDDASCPTRLHGIQVKLDVDGRRRVFGLPQDDPPPVRGARMVDAGGFSDDPPVQWSVIQIARSAATVRMETGPDSFDEMRPVRGYAVVATKGTLGPLTGLDASGNVVVSCRAPIPNATCNVH